jgi:hypothetical protein
VLALPATEACRVQFASLVRKRAKRGKAMDTQDKTIAERTVTFDSVKRPLSDLLTVDGIEELVRSRPVFAFAGAGVLGAVLGGLLFPRLGRLAFLAVAGCAATGLLQRQRALDIEEVVARPKRAAF